MNKNKYNLTSLEQIELFVLECEIKIGYRLLKEDENI